MERTEEYNCRNHLLQNACVPKIFRSQHCIKDYARELYGSSEFPEPPEQRNHEYNRTSYEVRFCFRSNDSTTPWLSKKSRGCCYALHTPANRAFFGFWSLAWESARSMFKSGLKGFWADEWESPGSQNEWKTQGMVCVNWRKRQSDARLIFKQEKGTGSSPAPNSLRTAEPTAFSRVFTPFSRFFNGFCLSWPVWVNFAKNKKSVGQNNRMYYNISLFPWVKAKSKVDCALT